jgi:hypothetical protein
LYTTRYSGGQFTDTYIGNYTNIYSKAYTDNYTKAYTTNYTLQYTQSYTGTYTSNYTLPYTLNYIGTYAGTYSTSFTGNYTKRYTGTYTGEYTGQYNVNVAYARLFNRAYVGQYLKEYTRAFYATSYDGFPYAIYAPPSYVADYSNTFIRYYALGSYAGQYTGNYTGTVGYIPAQTGYVQGYTPSFTGVSPGPSYINAYDATQDEESGYVGTGLAMGIYTGYRYTGPALNYVGPLTYFTVQGLGFKYIPGDGVSALTTVRYISDPVVPIQYDGTPYVPGISGPVYERSYSGLGNKAYTGSNPAVYLRDLQARDTTFTQYIRDYGGYTRSAPFTYYIGAIPAVGTTYNGFVIPSDTVPSSYTGSFYANDAYRYNLNLYAGINYTLFYTNTSRGYDTATPGGAVSYGTVSYTREPVKYSGFRITTDYEGFKEPLYTNPFLDALKYIGAISFTGGAYSSNISFATYVSNSGLYAGTSPVGSGEGREIMTQFAGQGFGSSSLLESYIGGNNTPGYFARYYESDVNTSNYLVFEAPGDTNLFYLGNIGYLGAVSGNAYDSDVYTRDVGYLAPGGSYLGTRFFGGRPSSTSYLGNPINYIRFGPFYYTRSYTGSGAGTTYYIGQTNYVREQTAYVGATQYVRVFYVGLLSYEEGYDRVISGAYTAGPSYLGIPQYIDGQFQAGVGKISENVDGIAYVPDVFYVTAYTVPGPVADYTAAVGSYNTQYIANYLQDVNYDRAAFLRYYVAPSYTKNYDTIYTQNYLASYTGDYTSNYVLNFNSNYSTNYTNSYEGQYTDAFNTQYGTTYASVSSLNFDTQYANNYTGGYTGANFETNYVAPQFIGSYQNEFNSTAYNTAYVRNIDAVAYITDYIGSPFVAFYDTTYTSTSSLTYTGSYDRTYTGNRAIAYSNDYANEFVSLYDTTYTKDIYVNAYTNLYERDFQGPSFATSYVGPIYTENYTNTYTSVFEGGSFATSYVKDTYAGTYDASYTNFFVSSYSNQYTEIYTNQYTNQYTSPQYVPNYTGIQETVYDKSYTGGNYDIDYVKSYSNDYTGDYTGSYDRTYLGSYQQDYVSFYENQYTTDYTTVYETQYLTDYIGNFEGNFEGTTIDETSDTEETYTLYVRIA